MNELIEKIKKARFIWICGNGGSAATAEHFTTDLVKKGYPAICLNSNTSVITMIANDYGYKTIFSKQIAVYGRSDDLLITISCSGESENIIEAIKSACDENMMLYEFPVFMDGVVKDYGNLENEHLRLAHEVTKVL